MLDPNWIKYCPHFTPTHFIINACIKSFICETWYELAGELFMLQSFINECQRIILRVFWPKTIFNESLRRDMGLEAIINEVRRKYKGHSLRNHMMTSTEFHSTGIRR